MRAYHCVVIENLIVTLSYWATLIRAYTDVRFYLRFEMYVLVVFAWVRFCFVYQLLSSVLGVYYVDVVVYLL